jgi:hypothetical protein
MKGTLQFSWELYNLRVFMNDQGFPVFKGNFQTEKRKELKGLFSEKFLV